MSKRFIGPRRVAASVTIKDANRMTEEGRREVAKWLRQQAKALVNNGESYNNKFKANYEYREIIVEGEIVND